MNAMRKFFHLYFGHVWQIRYGTLPKFTAKTGIVIRVPVGLECAKCGERYEPDKIVREERRNVRPL